MVLRFFILVLISILFYDLSLNLPLYLLKLNASTLTVNFCSGYIAFYETILLSVNGYFLYFLTNKYNFYLLTLIILGVLKTFNLILRLKYDWLVSKGLTNCLSFEEFQFIENSSFNMSKPLAYNFKTSFSIFKKIYVLSKYFYLFRNYIKLMLNYLIVFLKKFYLHLFGFVTKFNVTFIKHYWSHLNIFKTILWRPIFKKWSYFGLFRSYRSKWLNNK